MSTHRGFFWSLVGCVAAVVLFNVVTWHVATSRILTDTKVGDLARIGYLPEVVSPHPGRPDPTAGRFIQYWQYDGRPIDVVVAGDSFSQGPFGTWYQDDIAEIHGLSVMNLSEIFWIRGQDDVLETIVNLLNAGLFDEIGPRFLVLQMVERNCWRLAGEIDWDASDRADEFIRFLGSRESETEAKPPRKRGRFNTGNLKYVLGRAWYAFTDHDYDGKVYRVALDRDVFSVPPGNELVFYVEDLKWAREYGSGTFEKINSNLNELARRLAKRGIELIFVPAVNKYELYREFFVDGEGYPESGFFEEMGRMDRRYRFVDTKRILREMLERPTLDVFWKDETHWNWTGARAVVEGIAFD